MSSPNRRSYTAALLATALCLAIVPATGHSAIVLSGGGLTLVSEGGAIGAGNLSTSGTAFALDELGLGTHFTVNANNGTFGNASSWIGAAATQATISYGNRGFIGISLGAVPIRLGGFAFGRDNTGGLADRAESATPYVLQYTQVANPTSATIDTGNPVTGFADIGTLTYGVAGGANYAAPALRHEFTFNALLATGLRLLVPSIGTGGGTAIDEFEIFAFQIPEPSTLVLALMGMVGLAMRRRRNCR